MADYNLFGLETRSFEQLVQALAAKVIGPGVVIFGDGPDGAREASFEGSFKYGSELWNGYTVFQAKFKKRQETPKKDGEWVLQQTKAELEKFADQKRQLRKPQYYILATNVVLTPVDSKGMKDKVYNLLAGWAPKLGLKKYDVWDYDKIRVLLDGNRDVAVSFAAFVTCGDVLTHVISSVLGKEPDFKTTLSNFLQKELLSDLYANLEQAGHSVTERVPLSRVFVDLATSVEPTFVAVAETETKHQRGVLSEILLLAAQKLDPKSIISSGTKLARQQGRVVIIGGPGQGKTTLSQFICQLFRVAILNTQSRLSPQVVRALNELNEQITAEQLSLPSARRFPFRIVLSDFATALANDPQLSLVSYITNWIAKRAGRTISLDLFGAWLGAYPWLLILDGLDEVPASSNRDQLMSAIDDFWIDATERNSDILVIATTRPQGYTKEFSPEFYEHRWLSPLSDWRALHYGERLVKVRFATDTAKQEKVIARLRRACQEETTARLMRSPLQVTIMATLVDRVGQPPQERWNLFKEYYNVIYQREVEREIPASLILRSYKPDVDAIHRRVALTLHRETENAGRTEARLKVSEFQDIVNRRLREEGHTGLELKDLQGQIMEAATDRLVFLVGVESGQVGFEIRSLQEFMAAEGIMDGGDELVRKRLRMIAPSQNWRNVFLFAAGKCFAERQDLRDSIHTICAELNEALQSRLPSAILLGSQVALDLLEDGPARTQPRYSEILARLALRLTDLPPHRDQARLGGMIQPNLESVFEQECKVRLERRESAETLGAVACILSLSESSELRHRLSKQLPAAKAAKDFFFLRSAIPVTPENVEILLPAFANLSPARLASIIQGNREEVYLPRKDVPAWFDAASDLASQRFRSLGEAETFLRLVSSSSQSYQIRFHKISENWLAPLAAMPAPCKEWGVVLSAQRFLQSPSASTLSRELEFIRHQQADLPAAVERIHLPWIIRAIVLAATNQDHLSAFSKKVAHGEFGDVDDWLKAEHRWVHEGIRYEDLEYSSLCPLPFDKEIAKIGFPFAAENILLRESDRPRVERHELMEIFRRIHLVAGRTHLAAWIPFFVAEEDESDINDLYSQDDIEALLVSALPSVLGVNLELLAYAVPGERWLSVLDLVGRHARRIYYYSPLKISSQVINDLIMGFARDPGRTGILRVLAALHQQLIGLDLFPPLLEEVHTEDARIMGSVLILQFIASGGSRERAAAIARRVVHIHVRNENMSFLREFLAVFDAAAATAHPEFCEAVLLSLLDSLPSENWIDRKQTLVRLNALLARSMTPLSNPAVWADLGLH